MLLGLVALLDVLWQFGGIDVPFRGTTLAELQGSMRFLSALVVLIGAAAGVFVSARRMGWRNLSHVATIVAFGALALLTIRTSIAANYVRYDEQTEFINYASGAPGIRVVMEQVEEISRRATDGLGIRVAYDDDVSWPFTWYLRNYPNQVFFGGEPSRDSFRDTPLVIAGDNNWPKVEAMLGDKYYSFEHIRMWWPMQDYFHLTIDRVRSNLVEPARRAALWDIWFRRDYTRYGELHGSDFSLSNWPVADRMRFYIEKDLAAQLWNLGIGPVVLSEPAEADPYEALTRVRAATLVWGAPGTGVGEFDRPRDVAVGPDGFVYVADTFNHRIQKFDRDGGFVLEWGGFGMVVGGDAALGRLNEPWGLSVSDDGFVYVADTWNHRMQKFTLAGQPVAAWGRFGDDMDLQNMWGPREVAIGPQGLVYVSDTGNKRVSVFTPEGKGVRQIGLGGALDGQLDEPVGLAVSDEGSVFVADTWNGRVQLFDGAGDTLRQWEVPGWHGQSLDNKPYLAVDGEGRVFASDPEGYRILVWDAVGNPFDLWGDYGSDVASFDLPTGIALDAKGGLYVTDAGNNRMMYFAPE
jgi:DNA-binding beta-propeller fold protein YncE